VYKLVSISIPLMSLSRPLGLDEANTTPKSAGALVGALAKHRMDNPTLG
jgi:hypothetical protein